MRARANAVFPAPSPPDKVTRSPAPTSAAISAASPASELSSLIMRDQIISVVTAWSVPAAMIFTFPAVLVLLPASHPGKERCKSRGLLLLGWNRFRRGRRAVQQKSARWKDQGQRRDGAIPSYGS